MRGEMFTDEVGIVWERPTELAYAQACKAVSGRQLKDEIERDALDREKASLWDAHYAEIEASARENR